MNPKKRSGKRSYHHGNAKQALLEAATELIQEHGAEGFSMREAARLVGIDPAACYRHFRDRNALLIALAQQGFVQLSERMRVARLSNDDAEQAILAMGRTYVDYALERPAQFRVMFGGAGTPARDDRLRAPELQESAFELLQQCLRAWSGAEPAIAEAQALLLWAAVHGMARLLIDGALPLSSEAVGPMVDRLCLATLRGIANE